VAVYPVRVVGRSVTLREFERSDARAVLRWTGDPEAVKFVPLGPFDAVGVDGYLAQLLDEARERPRAGYTLAVVEHASQEVVGSVALGVDSRVHRRVELGYILRRDAWGRGLATEAAALALDFAFERLGANRVWAVCDPENAPSIGVLEKLGMSREGHLRQDMLIHGEWRDSLLYAVLADDRAATVEHC
jgi:[ribosomal protein S5]-alanine N-acetyltransferase